MCRIHWKRPHPSNPPNRKTEISQYKLKVDQNLNLNLYRKIPSNLRFSIWWISKVWHFKWKLSDTRVCKVILCYECQSERVCIQRCIVLYMSIWQRYREQMGTGWRKLLGRLKLKVICCKRATNSRVLWPQIDTCVHLRLTHRCVERRCIFLWYIFSTHIQFFFLMGTAALYRVCSTGLR